MGQNIKRISIFCIYLFSIMIVMLAIMVSKYSVHAGDDFQIINSMSREYENIFKYLWECVQYSVSSWRSWQGTYFAMFIQAALIKIDFASDESHRAFIIISNVLLFTTIVIFVRLITARIKSELIKAIILFATIYSLVMYNAYSEIYYWYTGIVAYSFPLMAVILGLGLIFHLSDNAKWKSILLPSFLGAVGMGGTLVHVALGCSVLALIVVYRSVLSNKIAVKETIIFGIWLACGLFNAFSPGNFVRKEYSSGAGFGLKNALFNTVIMTDQRFQIFFTTSFVTLLVIVLVCGCFSANQWKVTNCYLTISIIAILIPFITTFPVMLGYGRQNLPERCAFVVDVAIIMVLFNLAFAAGNHIGCRHWNDNALALCIIGVAFVSVIDGYGISDTKGISMINGLQEGIYENYYESSKSFYEYLENAEKGTDIVVPNELSPEPINDFFCLEVYGSDWWINQNLATYYGLNSVSVEQ